MVRASIAAMRTRGCSLELPYSIYVYFSFVFHDEAKRTQQGNLLPGDAVKSCHAQVSDGQVYLKQ